MSFLKRGFLPLKRSDDVVSRDTLMPGNSAEDGNEGPES